MSKLQFVIKYINVKHERSLLRIFILFRPNSRAGIALITGPFRLITARSIQVDNRTNLFITRKIGGIQTELLVGQTTAVAQPTSTFTRTHIVIQVYRRMSSLFTTELMYASSRQVLYQIRRPNQVTQGGIPGQRGQLAHTSK